MNDEARTPPATIVTFLATAALLVAYAVDGGTYDLIARQEFGLLIWWTLFLTVALGLLPVYRPGAPVVLALLGLGGLALWAAMSLSWSQSDERTLAEVARTLHHLGLFALVIVVAGRKRWVAVIGGATLGAVIVSGISLGVRLAPGTFGADTTARAFTTDRLSSPLGYWNAVGAWSAMTIGLLLAWSAHARTSLVRALALAAVPAVVVVLYLTYSRAGVADLAVGVVLVVAFASRRWTTALHALAGLALGGGAVLVARGQPAIADLTGTAGRGTLIAALAGCALIAALVAVGTQRTGLDRVRMAPHAARRTLLIGGLIAAVALTVAAIAVVPSAWDDFSHPGRAAASTDPAARLTNLNSRRYFIYRSALQTFRDEPLKGSGAGTFEFTYNRDGGEEYLRDAHSLYLEPLSELGVLGGLLVLLLAGGIVATVVSARRRAREDEQAAGAIAGCAAACGAYLVAAGVDWMWEVTAVSALFFMLAGSAAAATLRDSPPVVGRVGRGAVALVALLAVLVTIPGLRSAVQVRDSQRAVGRGDLAAATAAARDAEKSAPWAATPYLQLGLVDEQAGRLESARAQLLAAREREPTNWRIPFVLSRVEAELGDPRAALRSYRTARRLRPKGSVFVDASILTSGR